MALVSPGTLGEIVRVGIPVLASAEGLVVHKPMVAVKPGERVTVATVLLVSVLG